jgi:outer membrane lipopolysaccharide assembly protein LptE/RlpB
MRFGKLVIILLIALSSGCGYRLAARKGDVGAGRTLAVPTFSNLTTTYRIEQRISEAVRQEFARSTHYKVTSADRGDVVIRGEVSGYGQSPTVFDSRGRAAQYLVSVQLKVIITEAATGKTLFQNDAMTLRDYFQISQSAGDFVPEDPAALARMAERFASAVAAALVHSPT